MKKTNGLWFVAIAISGYLAFNMVIWAFGGYIMTMGLMNGIAGAVNFVIAHHLKQRAPIRWWVASIGAAGITATATGLGKAYQTLSPATVIALTYDLVVVSLVFFFWMVPSRLGAGFGKRPDGFDLRRHLAFLLLIAARFLLHHTGKESPEGFAFVALTVAGYLFFNLSVKMANGERPTNATMNLLGGIGLATVGFVSQPVAPVHIFAAIAGAVTILALVFGLGQAYTRISNPSTVGGLVYDGLMTFGPVVFLCVVPNTAWRWWDWLISAACLLIMLDRYFHHEHGKGLLARAKVSW